jgi:hypothetical protein
MIKDLFDNILATIENEQNKEKILNIIDPWIRKIRWICYIIIMLLLTNVILISIITYKIYNPLP